MSARDELDPFFAAQGRARAEDPWIGVPSPQGERDLVLYKYDTCPYCRRVTRVLDALAQQVDVRQRDLFLDRDARDTLFERTGRTTVPCLFIDDEPLFESQDIIAWLRAHAQWRSGRGDGATA